VRAGSLPGSTTYAYDVRDRLTEVCFQASCPGGSDPFIRWTYDAVGNRLTEARPSATTTYTYDAADEMTAAGSTTHTYDQNGNETTAGLRTFSYNLANRLSSTTSAGTTTSYSYDGDGNRLQATSGGQSTNYVWDRNRVVTQLALERDGSGALLRRYIYGNRRISMRTDGSDYFYHYDALGSVSNLTSSAGVNQWSYEYEPYGRFRTVTQESPSAPENLMTYAGEMADSGELYYLHARQYDPTSGRFLQLDPLRPPPTAPAESSFAYVSDRPTVLVDPTGTRAESSNAAQDAAEDAASPALWLDESPSQCSTHATRTLASASKGATCAVMRFTGKRLRRASFARWEIEVTLNVDFYPTFVPTVWEAQFHWGAKRLEHSESRLGAGGKINPETYSVSVRLPFKIVVPRKFRVSAYFQSNLVGSEGVCSGARASIGRILRLSGKPKIGG